MNAANLCPSLAMVTQEIARYSKEIDLDPSFPCREKFKQLTNDSRSAIAAQLGVTPTEIALVRNTSEGNNIITSGLDLGPGDQVVVWEQNHPTNHVAWQVRSARERFSVREVSLTHEPKSIDDLITPFLDVLNPRTRVLAVTHVSNTSGIKLPIGELASVCRERGIHFHVDGAQTWGALDVDLGAIGCDSFSGSAHKWFLGPKEVGILYVRAEVAHSIWPSVVAPDWGSDTETDLTAAQRFESLGQRDDAALAALVHAADFRNNVGGAKIEQHIIGLAQQLKEGFLELGAALVTPTDPLFSGGVVIVAVDRQKRVELWERLYNDYGIIGAPTGGLRLSPHIYNTTAHVETALRGYRELRRHLL